MQPEQIVGAILLVSLTLYAVLGGADFGAGVWEVNTALGASERERGLIYRAMGPVWEANHVWLIFVIIGLFTAFPPALAAVSRALWIPLLLALVGIIFRGVGFAFRSYAVGAVRQQALWAALFALASTAAPFFLGAAVGAVASGRLDVGPHGGFTGNYVTGWVTPTSIFSAFFAVGMCAYLAAVYLAREASNEGGRRLVLLWRRRALATGAWMGVLAIAGLAMLATDAPALWAGFRSRAWPLVAASVGTGLLSLWALQRWWFTAAVFGAASTVATVVWGWAVAQYPVIIPPTITIETAKAPQTVLVMMIWAIAAGALLLGPSLGYLFYLFKGKRQGPVMHAKG